MAFDRDRLLEQLSRLRAGPRVVREHRGAVGLVVIVALAVAAWFAFKRVDLDLRDLDVRALALAATLGVPATTVANALEHRAVGRYVGRDIPLRSALRTAITATAANLLPLPAGIVVRVQDLHRRGAGLGPVGRYTLVAGAVWAAVAAVVAAVGLLVLDTPVAAGIAGALAVLAGAASLVLGGRDVDRGLGLLLGAEVLSVAASAARMLLLLAAVTGALAPAKAAVLAASGVVTQTIGFLPAGLGLKETATAALATAVALPAAIGLIVALLDRVIGLVVHALMAVPLWLGPTPSEEPT